MVWFILIALCLIGGSTVVLLFPFFKNSVHPQKSEDQTEINLRILRRELQIAKEELDKGLMTEAQWEVIKADLEKRTLVEVMQTKNHQESPTKASRSKILPISLAILTPCIILGLYLLLGNPLALQVQKDPQLVQIEAMVKQLESKLKENPGNSQGWMFLGRSYVTLGRFTEAKMAYKKAIELDPKNANLFADLADLVAYQQKSINTEALEYVAKALQIEPTNPKALAIRGSSFFDQKQYAQALADWKLALKALPANDTEFRSGLTSSILETEELLHPSKSSKNASNTVLKGVVSLSPALKANTDPNDTVFIYARAQEGPKMPLAIQKIRVAELPYQFELSDQQAMSPSMALSKFNEFTVIARISKSGNASPQAGDLLGQKEHIKIGASNLSITIDHAQ